MPVCVSVCSGYSFWIPSHRNFIFGMQVHPYQGHWIKAKVIWQNANFTYFKMLFLDMWLQVINKVKVTDQGKGHIKVKIKISTSLQILCSSYSPQADGLHSTEMRTWLLITFSWTSVTSSQTFCSIMSLCKAAFLARRIFRLFYQFIF